MSWGEVNEAIQAAAREQSPDRFNEGIAVRTVIITEWAFPGDARTVFHTSLASDSHQLRPWEVAGLCAAILTQVLNSDR